MQGASLAMLPDNVQGKHMSANTPRLFDPIQLGDIAAPNRILMAPLTRGRSADGHVPITELKAAYYAQRASAGLIISEATGISQEGLGWPSAPGLWTDAQVEGWKPVTEAVHAAGGRIVAQLDPATVSPAELGSYMTGAKARDLGNLVWKGAPAKLVLALRR